MAADNYAARILAAREKAGMGQRRFARLLGVGIGTIQHWEHERRQPQGLYQERLESILREIEGNQAPRS
jgi:DNA-binding transcriptional regulator YiaG